jgi:hypothetical protein
MNKSIFLFVGLTNIMVFDSAGKAFDVLGKWMENNYHDTENGESFLV